MRDVVDLVHRQLECLKYVGGTRTMPGGETVPSGQGMEIGIVLLPDLLVDVRRFKLKDGEGMFAVGGRAARMACALLHLQDAEDGTFQVHLLTRTGNLGLLLLKNEFCEGSEAWPYPAPFMEYIIRRKGEPRCAIRDAPGAKVISSARRSAFELQGSDLQRPDIRDLITRARTICLTSLSTPDFATLFRLVVEGVTPARQGLFLDTRHATGTGMEDLARLIRGLPPDKLMRITGLFLREDEEADFNNAVGRSSLAESCAALHVPVLAYGATAQLFFPERGDGPLSVPGCKDYYIEGVAEYFKAGFLLAWSLHRSIQDLSPRHEELQKLLLNEWSRESGYWQKVLAYGAALATARSQTGDRRCGLPDLFRGTLAASNSDHFPEATDYQPGQWLALRSGHKRERMIDMLPPSMSSRVARLAGCRRVSAGIHSGAARGENALACRDIATCEQPHCLNGCDKEGSALPVAAIMIDLDGTLMDSDEQRERALASALGRLGAPGPSETQQQVDFFNRYVYRRSAVYMEPHLELGDFRKEWNHRGWYLTYLVLAQDDGLRERLETLWSPDGHPLGGSDRRNAWKAEFLRAYQRVQSEARTRVQEAVAAFDGTDLYPFKEARDFLQTLSLTGSLFLYIVTEGHPDVQWSKLCRAGLTRYFDREHVLTTGDAVEPVSFRLTLNGERAELSQECAKLEAGIERHMSFLRELGILNSELLSEVAEPAAKRAIASVVGCRKSVQISEAIEDLKARLVVAEFRRRTGDFVDRVISRMNRKVLPFYASAIRAILRNPSAPRSVLRHFEQIIEPASPERKMKFAMIGDRQRNDILPSRILLQDDIVAIRINALKYSLTESAAGQERSAPDFVVETLAEAKAILLAKETWQNSSCTTDPPVFNWDLLTHGDERRYFPNPDSEDDSEIGLDFIVCGCLMERETYPSINRVCAGILVEHLCRCDQMNRVAFLAEEVGESVPAVDRVRLLCSLISAGAVQQGALLEEDVESTLRIISGMLPLRGGQRRVWKEIHIALDFLIRQGPAKPAREAQMLLKRLMEK